MIFLVACYKVAMTYKDYFFVACLSACLSSTKLVKTSSQKLLAQFHPNFTGMMSNQV
jgi:hypothetical protein